MLRGRTLKSAQTTATPSANQEYATTSWWMMHQLTESRDVGSSKRTLSGNRLCDVSTRECTDLTTGSELALISVYWRSVRSNERSVTDLAVVRPVNTIQCNRSI